MQKGTLLYIALALVHLASPSAFAQDSLKLAEGRLIELYLPMEVVCQPAADAASEAETIILKPGEDRRAVCPDDRLIMLGFSPEVLSGEPPPPRIQETEAQPSAD